MATGSYPRAVTGITATGVAGAVVRHPAANFTIQCVTRNAAGAATTATAVKVNIQGSLNGTDWFTLGNWDSAAPLSNGDITSVPGTRVPMWRINVQTLTLGTAATLDVFVYTTLD